MLENIELLTQSNDNGFLMFRKWYVKNDLKLNTYSSVLYAKTPVFWSTKMPAATKKPMARPLREPAHH